MLVFSFMGQYYLNMGQKANEGGVNDVNYENDVIESNNVNDENHCERITSVLPFSFR